MSTNSQKDTGQVLRVEDLTDEQRAFLLRRRETLGQTDQEVLAEQVQKFTAEDIEMAVLHGF